MLSCPLALPGPVYLTVGGNAWRALGTAVGQIDRNLAAHRDYQPSEP